MEKYGKPMAEIIRIKKGFFEDNDSLLNNSKRQAYEYKKQPIRSSCKLCDSKLGGTVFFHSHGIDYIKCSNCGHINGKYQDTQEYNKALYVSEDYGEVYKEDEKGYWNRVESIYMPKLDFLLAALGDKAKEYKVLDIGGGSGYFVAAGIQHGISIKGVEPSIDQCYLGNKMIGQDVMIPIELDEITQIIKRFDGEVLTAIGVLEHLGNLREVLSAISCNSSIKYVFFSVPMFSVSVIMEIMNPDCFNRHLSGGHTHLFTNKSIDYLCSLLKSEIITSWRFGSDIMDLFRMMCVKTKDYSKLSDEIMNVNVEVLDELQLVLDKAEISSEKHFVLKKDNS